MSKKKTPQEKKEAAYEKDHYTFAWHSPHSFRKGWNKKKKNANRVIRRKSKGLLHAVQNSTCEDLGPEHECLTAELFRKGLSRKRLLKTGVVNLREKIKTKKEYRESSWNLNARSRAGRMEGFRRFLAQLISDAEYSEKNLRSVSGLSGDRHFQQFLDEEPSWIPKLQQWVRSAQRKAKRRLLKSQQMTAARSRFRKEVDPFARFS